MNVALVIPAAGAGERLAAGRPKALATVASRSLLSHALQAALAASVVDVTAIAAPLGRADTVLTDLRPYLSGVDVRVVNGGASRQESVWLALQALPPVDIILVHDAARCFAPPQLFREVVAAVAGGLDAVIPVLPVVDTLKQVEADRVVATPDRSVLRAVQTPQGFRAAALLKAHRLALDNGTAGVTDDAGLIEAMGGVVHVIPGHDDAFKITRPADRRLAEAVFAARASGVRPEEL
jgi:2-C-methyl-D-erythritol 4-phosphate cytidylyltransferase